MALEIPPALPEMPNEWGTLCKARRLPCGCLNPGPDLGRQKDIMGVAGYQMHQGIRLKSKSNYGSSRKV